MNNLLNMIFSELRVIIPLFISIYYIVKKGFANHTALISLLQTIAFINGVFFLPTLFKFFKRIRINKKIEKVFRTANRKDLKDNDICIICRLKMYPKKAKKLPCKHCYHIECLERWIGENDSCPICLEKISDLLDKEAKRKDQRSKRRKHKKTKAQIANDNNVFNYADIANDISDSNEEDQDQLEEDRITDENDNKEVDINDKNMYDNNIKEGETIGGINNESVQTEQNSYVKVIDLDKICSDRDEKNYSCGYYDYYDYSDNNVEQ